MYIEKIYIIMYMILYVYEAEWLLYRSSSEPPKQRPHTAKRHAGHHLAFQAHDDRHLGATLLKSYHHHIILMIFILILRYHYESHH